MGNMPNQAATISIDISSIPAPPRQRQSYREEDRQPIIPPRGWYPIFKLGTRHITPLEALAAVEKGATFEDLEAAREAIALLGERARLPYDRLPGRFDSNAFPFRVDADRPEPLPDAAYLVNYVRPVEAAAARQRMETALQVAEVAGIVPGADAAPGEAPKLLTAQELADLFRVSLDSIDRWVNKGLLPAPLQIGGSERGHRRWIASSIYRLVWNGIRPEERQEVVAA